MHPCIGFIGKLSWRWPKALPWRWLAFFQSFSKINELIHGFVPFTAPKLSTKLFDEGLKSHILITVRRGLFDHCGQFLKRLAGCTLAIGTGTTVDSVSSRPWRNTILYVLYDLVPNLLIWLRLRDELSDPLLILGRYYNSTELPSWFLLCDHSPTIIFPLLSRCCSIMIVRLNS